MQFSVSGLSSPRTRQLFSRASWAMISASSFFPLRLSTHLRWPSRGGYRDVLLPARAADRPGLVVPGPARSYPGLSRHSAPQARAVGLRRRHTLGDEGNKVFLDRFDRLLQKPLRQGTGSNSINQGFSVGVGRQVVRFCVRFRIEVRIKCWPGTIFSHGSSSVACVPFCKVAVSREPDGSRASPPVDFLCP